MSEENSQQFEILEPLQSETYDRLSSKIHDKTIRAEESDNEIDSGFLLWRNYTFAFLVGLSDYRFWGTDRNETFQLRIICGFYHSDAFHQVREVY